MDRVDKGFSMEVELAEALRRQYREGGEGAK